MQSQAMGSGVFVHKGHKRIMSAAVKCKWYVIPCPVMPIVNRPLRAL